MELEDDHEEEEEEDEELCITPPYKATDIKTNNMMVIKKHTSPTVIAHYRECLKNHAVTIGGHAVDGCGEFMPGTLDSLRCAACNCHRNFHRKEILDNVNLGQQLTLYPPRPHPSAAVFPFYPYPRTTAPHTTPPSGYLHVASGGQSTRPLALPSPGLTLHNSTSDDGMEGGNGLTMASSSGKKRFRTKFTREQKDKMLAFADKLGWRIQKKDEESVKHFCGEIGVERHVLKVWMHNNKHTLRNKP